MSINQFIRKKLRPRTVFDYTAELVKGGDCKSGLDIGCGSHSDLSAFRPALRTVGIDAFPMAIEMAKGKHLERTKRIYVMLYCNRSPFFLFYQSATTRQSYFTIFGKIIGRSSLSSENLGYTSTIK